MTEQRFDPDHSFQDEIEENRAFKGRRRCVLNFPCVGKQDDVIHAIVDRRLSLGDRKTRCCTSGGVLAIGPCFAVRHWSVTQATVSLSSAESEAKAITKGCIEALYAGNTCWNTSCMTIKIVFGLTAEHAIQRLGTQSKTLAGQTSSWQDVSSR